MTGTEARLDPPAPARHVSGDRRGQTLVEFALTLPVLILLVVALFDLGRAVYAWSAVSNAARDGARVAIVDQGMTGGIANAAQAAADQATGLGLDASNAAQVLVQYVAPDLASSCPAHAIGCVAQVRVQYQFVPITPVIGRLVGPVTLSSTTSIPIERTSP